MTVSDGVTAFLAYKKYLSTKQTRRKTTIQLENQKEELIHTSSFSFRELENEEPNPTTFIVDRILPTGLNLLCGSSKIGKSWFALELAIDVARGERFLGFRTNRCSVFYYALEDTRNRLYERSKTILEGEELPSSLKGNTCASSLSSSFLCELERELNNDPTIKLVIVDTFQKIRGKARSNEQAYAYDYREMSSLKRFADEKGICMLLIHHTRKAMDNDKYNMVNGTTGIIGSADNTMILSKDNRMDSKATLSITGRDIESQEYVLDFNSSNCKWEMRSTVAEELEKETMDEFNKSFVVTKIFSTPRPFSITAAELADTIADDFGVKMDLFKVGQEINKFQQILLEKYRIKHSFKRTSTKRIHTFEDI